MRYQVGQVLPVITLLYDDKNSRLFFTPYLPWADRKLEGIKFEHLTVTEHHRVLNEWANNDDVPDCDGYRLTASDGSVWHNQYPRASYGQTTNTADFLFDRYVEEGKLKQFLEESKDQYSYRLLTDYLKALKHGIYKREQHEAKNKMMDTHIAETKLLQAHFDEVVRQYEQESGNALIFTKLMAKLDSGEEVWVEGWWQITIGEQEPVNEQSN